MHDMDQLYTDLPFFATAGKKHPFSTEIFVAFSEKTV